MKEEKLTGAYMIRIVDQELERRIKFNIDKIKKDKFKLEYIIPKLLDEALEKFIKINSNVK